MEILRYLHCNRTYLSYYIISLGWLHIAIDWLYSTNCSSKYVVEVRARDGQGTLKHANFSTSLQVSAVWLALKEPHPLIS
jgi:hypothetical protein